MNIQSGIYIMKSLNDGLIWNSLTECTEYYKLHKSTIIRVCKGERKQAHGFTFEYTQGELNG